MDPNAVEQAAERLTRAEKALQDLKHSSSFVEAEAAWRDFLLAINSIYSKLEQGAKTSGKSKAWFGRKKNERKNDPLLRYLHFARNSDEHGIERITERQAGSTLLEKPMNRPLEFNEQVPGTITKFDPDTRTLIGEAANITIDGPHLMLVTAHDSRFGDSCDPPKEHFGENVDHRYPLGVGEAALPHFVRMISDASDLT